MDADYDILEIVAVIRDYWLVDAESYQRRYYTNQGEPLAPGYYVVNWPEHIRARRFNEHATFHGPFKLRKEAQAAQDVIYQERKSMSSRISSITVPGYGPMEVKKAASPELGRADGATVKQTICGRKSWISGVSPPDYRETVTVAVR